MKVGDTVVVRGGGAAVVVARLYTGLGGAPCAHVRCSDGSLDSFPLKDLVPVDKPKCAPGSKYDTDKPDWSLVQWRALDKYVRVLTFGAAKYDRDNWQKVPNLRHRYLAAALRHVAAYATGENKDPESGEHHLAHAIACLAFVLEDILTNEKEPQP